MEKSCLPEIVSPLLEWFDRSARVLPWRESPLPYHVWISEIMLQQTRVEAVKPYFDRWLQAFPTLNHVAEASEDQLLLRWEGLGYYNRVRNIKKAAQVINEKYNGKIPAAYQELVTLPGIGEYTAGAIASIAFQQPVPCVDGNVLRVIARLSAIEEDMRKAPVKAAITEQIRKTLPKDRPGDFNQALMELGALICIPNGQPKCEICPLGHLCSAFRMDTVMRYPLKEEKKMRTIEDLTVFIILRNGQIGIRKRSNSGLLAGLWELPNIPGRLTKSSAKAALENWGLKPEKMTKLKEAKHIFTHKEWHMTGYYVLDNSSPEEKSGLCWADPDTLKDNYAIPTAFQPFVKQLQKMREATAQDKGE